MAKRYLDTIKGDNTAQIGKKGGKIRVSKSSVSITKPSFFQRVSNKINKLANLPTMAEFMPGNASTYGTYGYTLPRIQTTVGSQTRRAVDTLAAPVMLGKGLIPALTRLGYGTSGLAGERGIKRTKEKIHNKEYSKAALSAGGDVLNWLLAFSPLHDLRNAYSFVERANSFTRGIGGRQGLVDLVGSGKVRGNPAGSEVSAKSFGKLWRHNRDNFRDIMTDTGIPGIQNKFFNRSLSKEEFYAIKDAAVKYSKPGESPNRIQFALFGDTNKDPLSAYSTYEEYLSDLQHFRPTTINKDGQPLAYFYEGKNPFTKGHDYASSKYAVRVNNASEYDPFIARGHLHYSLGKTPSLYDSNVEVFVNTPFGAIRIPKWYFKLNKSLKDSYKPYIGEPSYANGGRIKIKKKDVYEDSPSFWSKLSNVVRAAAVFENPSVMTAAGYRVTRDGRAVQDQTYNKGVKQLRKNLAIIGENSIAAPTAVKDVELLYNAARHPVQSARAVKQVAKSVGSFAKDLGKRSTSKIKNILDNRKLNRQIDAIYKDFVDNYKIELPITQAVESTKLYKPLKTYVSPLTSRNIVLNKTPITEESLINAKEAVEDAVKTDAYQQLIHNGIKINDVVKSEFTPEWEVIPSSAKRIFRNSILGRRKALKLSDIREPFVDYLRTFATRGDRKREAKVLQPTLEKVMKKWMNAIDDAGTETLSRGYINTPSHLIESSAGDATAYYLRSMDDIVANNIDNTSYKDFIADLLHELRHRLDAKMPLTELEENILNTAYGDLFKADNPAVEMVTSNQDLRQLLLHRRAGRWSIKEQNKFLDELPLSKIYKAIPQSNGYMERFYKRLMTLPEEERLKRLESIRAAMKYVGGSSIPIGIGYNYIRNLDTKPALYARGGTIHIKPANRGKFNALKKRTGKTTKELTHSKNPLTRKRAIFAQNARKWKH